MSWVLSILLLIITTATGFIAMRPTATAKARRAFWVVMVLFFVSLCWPFYQQAPYLCWVPLVPAFLFARSAYLAERTLAQYQQSNDEGPQQ